jgi:hypothetical protein
MSNKIDYTTRLLYIKWILEECEEPAEEIHYLISLIQDEILDSEQKRDMLEANIDFTLRELATRAYQSEVKK